MSDLGTVNIMATTKDNITEDTREVITTQFFNINDQKPAEQYATLWSNDFICPFFDTLLLLKDGIDLLPRLQQLDNLMLASDRYHLYTF